MDGLRKGAALTSARCDWCSSPDIRFQVRDTLGHAGWCCGRCSPLVMRVASEYAPGLRLRVVQAKAKLDAVTA